jgi:LPXTG-motif cell wall-anchored protein
MALVLLVSLVGMSEVGAETAVDRAAQALRHDRVFVDPGAERTLSASDAARLRDQIRATGQRIFVALLPVSTLAETGVSANNLPDLLARTARLPGTYAVVVGNSFRARSTGLNPVVVDAMAAAAFDQHSGEGTMPVLQDFISRVASVGSGGSSLPASVNRQTGNGSSGTVLAVLVGLVVLAAVSVLVICRRRRRPT